MKEHRVSIDEFYNYNQYAVNFVMRVVTTRPGNAKAIQKLAVEQLEEIMISGLSSGGKRYNDFFRQLEQENMAHYKYTIHKIGDVEYYYHQMAFNLLDKDLGYRGNITSILRQVHNRAVDVNTGTTVVPSIPSDMILIIGGLSLNGNINGTTLFPRRDEELVKIIKQIVGVNNDIAIKTSVKTGKTYMNRSVVRFYTEWFDDILTALNGSTNGTYIISQCNNVLPSFVASRLKSDSGGHTFENTYKNRVFAEIHDNTLVLYDGRGGYETVKPYIAGFGRAGVKLLVITQFASNKDLFFTPETRTFEPVAKTVLHFVNREKLLLSSSKLTIKSTGINMGGTIYFSPSLKQKKKRNNYSVSFNGSNQAFRGEFVIPYDKEETQNQALSLIQALYLGHKTEMSQETFRKYIQGYNDVLVNNNNQGADGEEDILVRWFNYCNKSTADNDGKILQSYKRMKEQMEEEYKALGTYLAHFDFSKCMAVPKIIIDKKLKNNLYNTLHVESKNVIINSINNKKINPISEIQPTAKIKVDVRLGMGKVMVLDEVPLKKFYNARTNTLELDYNKLKGAAIYDKIKSRR